MAKVRYSTGVKREISQRQENAGRVYELKLAGKHPLVPGKEISFKGERGRFRFKWAVETADGWNITVFGGTKRYQSYRTFSAGRLKTVHRKERLRK